MPPTSPRIAQEVFDALLFTPFHDNVTIYPDDVYVATPRRENFRPLMASDTPVVTYVSVLSAGQPLSTEPVSTMMQGSFPLPDHAVAAITAILLRFLPPFAYYTTSDSYRTFGLLTQLCLPLSQCFLMAVTFLVWILTQQ